MLEAELMPSKYNLDLLSTDNGYSDDWTTPAIDPIKQEIDVVSACYFHPSVLSMHEPVCQYTHSFCSWYLCHSSKILYLIAS